MVVSHFHFFLFVVLLRDFVKIEVAQLVWVVFEHGKRVDRGVLVLDGLDGLVDGLVKSLLLAIALEEVVLLFF